MNLEHDNIKHPEIMEQLCFKLHFIPRDIDFDLVLKLNSSIYAYFQTSSDKFFKSYNNFFIYTFEKSSVADIPMRDVLKN